MTSVKKENPEIFKLTKLIKNLEIKASAATEGKDNQILCFVLTNNELVFRYCTRAGEIIVKSVKYFADTARRIQDLTFDTSGSWLLVLCYDNTLHIVPAVYICDKSAKFQLIFSAQEISSFVVPFSPPHNCPNVQTCPNNLDALAASPLADLDKFSTTRTFLPSSGKVCKDAIAPNSFYNQFYCEAPPQTDDSQNNNANMEGSQTSLSVNQSNSRTASTGGGSTPMDSQVFSSSCSPICPYPTAIAWWQTIAGHYRAIVGYSEGTICMVALTLNCPFIGSTSVERGAIDRLVVCRDNASETITLMINTSRKEQWKLLLEQKSMGYTFPGEFAPISNGQTPEPTTSEHSEKGASNENWQFVLNLEKDTNGATADESHEEDFEKVQAEGSDEREDGMYNKIIPAAKARLLSLRDFGTKKIGTLKLKLAESRIKAKERGECFSKFSFQIH